MTTLKRLCSGLEPIPPLPAGATLLATGVKVTDLLYIDDLKVFAASESKLNRVLKETRGAMQDIGLH